MIAHIEWQWLERVRDSVLYRYELPPESLRQTSDEWMWVTDTEVTPLAVLRVDDLVDALGGVASSSG